MMLASKPVLGERSAEDGGLAIAQGLVLFELGGEGCLLLTTAVDSEAVRERLSEVLEIALPPTPGVGQAGGRWAIWLTPRSWLVSTGDGDEEEAMLCAVKKRLPDRSAHASRYSDSLCWLSLRGEGAGDLLRQGGFLTLESTGFPVGHIKRTPIADVPALVWRQERNVWRLGLERSRAAWFVDWMLSK